MDDNERQRLEIEVRQHGARIAQLKSSLRQLVEAPSGPSTFAKQVAALRMELRGRTAAFAVGAARLQWED